MRFLQMQNFLHGCGAAVGKDHHHCDGDGHKGNDIQCEHLLQRRHLRVQIRLGDAQFHGDPRLARNGAKRFAGCVAIFHSSLLQKHVAVHIRYAQISARENGLIREHVHEFVYAQGSVIHILRCAHRGRPDARIGDGRIGRGVIHAGISRLWQPCTAAVGAQ